MEEFIGRFEHSLDVKGRVILPAKLRGSFDTQAFLAEHHLDACLTLWTPEAFSQQKVDMLARAKLDEERHDVLLWSSSSTELELDRQGRVAIPPYLREYAGLEDDQPVMILGAIDHIQLWSPQGYAALRAARDARRAAAKPVVVPSA